MLLLSFALAAQAVSAPAVSGPRPLEGTHWKAIELAGRPVPSQQLAREIYLLLEERGAIYGSDGCNQVAGTYRLEKDSIRFSDMAETQRACIDTDNLDVTFRDALMTARRMTFSADRLELFDSDHRRVAVFIAVTKPSPDPASR